MVGSMNQNLQNCSFLISPTPTGVMRTSLPVLTVDHSGIQGRPTINRLRFDLPPQILSEIPDGLEPLSFLGAAYECGTRRFELSFPLNGCRVDGRLVTTGELAALLMKKKKAEIRVENRT